MKKLLFGLLGLLVTISGWSAETDSGPISSVTVAGLVAQNGTPTPTTPIDILSNNGVVKVRHQSGLPLGYTQVEYLQSSGTQYIDTSIIPNITTRVVAKIAFPDTAGTVLCWGSRSSGTYNTSLDQFYCGRTTTNLWYYSATTQTSIRSGISPNVFYDIDVTNTHVTATATQSIYLFALNNLGTATPDSASKIAKFEIYNNGVMVRNLVPVRRNSDNVLGMYDLVSGQFFTNQGTGTFTAGNTVSDPVEIYTDGEVETIADSANHTATVATLLGVGDYRDTQNINTGAITRKVGVKVLDGTENWSVATTNVLQADVLPNNVASTTSNTSLCSHLQYTTSSTLSGMPEYSFKNGTTTYPNRMYVKSSTLATDATTLKQYLVEQYAAGTPVIIIYPLATATTESVAGQTMTTAPVNNRTGGVAGMTITTLLSSGASIVTTIATNAIKIATTAYNSARFSPVVTELNDTIATIRSVVTNTINQTKAIADLQATKQTRPDENCPAGKKCLLVEDDAGMPHWYEIIENAD